MTESKFKVGDIVYSHRFGRGTIVDIDEKKSPVYPIKVDWEDGAAISWCGYIFTKEGRFNKDVTDPKYDIVIEGRLKEVEKDIELLERGEEKMEDNMKEELKVGDWVWLNPNEKGTIIFIYPNKETCLVDSELDGEVEAVMAGLTKVDYSPINPSHYQVKGIPEAIDIMKHLMTQEQFKGFLWGNIIKYAYRYGRKGDEHDTAGKIEWYANRLKEVCAEERKEQERELNLKSYLN